MFALTSLSPAPHQVDAQRAAIASWKAAGLHVRSFNHPSEIAALTPVYDVEWVPVDGTAVERFGRHYVPVHVLLQAAPDEPALVVNSDIELRLAPWELQRIRWLAADGLCVFVRYNWDGDIRGAVRELYGFDAFLFSRRDLDLFEPSFLSMGQPFWDYWLPYAFTAARRPVARVEFPVTFHKAHPRSWSWDAWHVCGREFARLAGVPVAGDDLDAFREMASRVRTGFDGAHHRIPASPRSIRSWIETTFRDQSPKTFLEIGAHCGTDTRWLAGIAGVTLHAFEPDPRNDPGAPPNVTVHRAAVSHTDGRAEFLLSDRGWGQPWTYSSSLRRPKHHLQRYPVTFGPAIDVPTITLDAFVRDAGLGTIDLIWAAVQGSEGDLLHGGAGTLRRTRYFYTEYSDEEMYEGQPGLHDILALLPDFRVIELWADHVLLENTVFTPR